MMKRLTEYVNGTPAIILHKLDFHFQANGAIGGDIARKLAAYEDTGLEPGEVETMRESKADAQFMLTELCRFCDYDRLEELAKADKEGRALTPPCKVGQTVYFLLRDSPFFYPGTRGWYISEHVVSEVCTRGFCTDSIEDDDEPIFFYPYSTIGVDAFLSREEADAELERRLK